VGEGGRSSGRDQAEIAWTLERMDETNLVKRVRKKKFQDIRREEGQRNHGMRW